MLGAAIAFGVLIGVALGMLGGGGSVLAVPVLVYVLGEGPQEATTASLVIVTVAALAGGLGQAVGGFVCWRHAGAFSVAAVPAIFAGTALGDAVSGSALLAGFALLMLGAAYATWRKAGDGGIARVESERACPPLRLPRDVAAGTGVGLTTGLFGVGGGFLIVPVLLIGLNLGTRSAIGTSLAIIAATSVIGFGVHLLAGRSIDVGITAAMAASCSAGAVAGGALGGRVPAAVLGRGFAALVALVAGYLLVASAFLGGPPGS